MRRTLLAATTLFALAACASQPAEPGKDEAKKEASKDEAKANEPEAKATQDETDSGEKTAEAKPEEAAPVEPPKFTRDNITGEEAYGKLKLGLTEAEVTAAFGEPEKTGSEDLMEATGEYIMMLEYPKQGLIIDLMRAEGTKEDARRVGGYTINPPSELKSRLGVGIGSSRADVEKHYGDLKDEDGFTNEDKFVAGSVYGGEIFNFKDGKVSSIFVGAAAE